MSTNTIAFFGASGGCVGFSLVHALKNGYTCRTLTRSDPEKLKTTLRERGVSQEAIEKQLIALQGDGQDKAKVKETITHNGKIVDKILSGIGTTAITVKFSIYPLVLKDAHVCETAMATLVKAATEVTQELPGSTKPALYVVSTTGISKGPRDVPIAFWLLYKWLLKSPHDDKEKMEELAVSSAKVANGPFDSAKIVRASLLTDGDSCGMDGIRAGTEAKPTVGYTISRSDVGLWIYKRWLEPQKDGDETGAYTITY
ncbi:hypothetical protein BDZ85DRAFT_138498 [Elsinoe ampelina]|uniref:NAD(P)-binding domain-containing protein n=1 Tax=Elsinoe ampelina TaxID=302913 RepID=A0A6A6G8V6_9PEZI|nr:hypothetical protein BDZ85DRAFT_138498 [Elsinoe ampelina]